MKRRATLLWACYLGSSWTWVIGMILPILLLHDHGPMGWVAFAIPNVLGAMAMGVVLTPRRSETMVREHTTACLGFSRVTMAFQVIALPWALVTLLGWPIETAIPAILVGYAIVLTVTQSKPLGIAAGVTVLSAVLFVWFAFQDAAWTGVFKEPAILPHLTDWDLWAFIPAAAFGFLLCPYLDLTFHQARQQSGPWTFVLGFGVVFFSMIVFSLAYSGVGVLSLTNGVFPGEGLLRWLLGGHIIIQSAFTVAVHLKQVQRIERSSMAKIALPLILFLFMAWLLMVKYNDPIAALGFDASQAIYRVLLIFYGTVFPGYVLLMVIPIRRVVPLRARLRVTLLAIGISLPFAFTAFVAAQPQWMIGVFVVFVVAWLIIPRLSVKQS